MQCNVLHPRSLSRYGYLPCAPALRLLEEVSGHETVSEHVSLRFSAGALFAARAAVAALPLQWGSASSCAASSSSSFSTNAASNREFSPLQRRRCYCCNYVKRLAYLKTLFENSFGFFGCRFLRRRLVCISLALQLFFYLAIVVSVLVCEVIDARLPKNRYLHSRGTG